MDATSVPGLGLAMEQGSGPGLALKLPAPMLLAQLWSAHWMETPLGQVLEPGLGARLALKLLAPMSWAQMSSAHWMELESCLASELESCLASEPGSGPGLARPWALSRYRTDRHQLDRRQVLRWWLVASSVSCQSSPATMRT